MSYGAEVLDSALVFGPCLSRKAITPLSGGSFDLNLGVLDEQIVAVRESWIVTKLGGMFPRLGNSRNEEP